MKTLLAAAVAAISAAGTGVAYTTSEWASEAAPQKRVELAAAPLALSVPPRFDFPFERPKKGVQRIQRIRDGRRSCVLPKPSADAFTIALGGYEGGRLSSVTVAGQGRETEVATLVIEPGTTPLYVVANTYTPMIWRIEGATERLERFVAAPMLGGAGVVGLPAERVTVTDQKACGRYHMGPKRPAEAAEAITMLEAALGRPLDGYAGDYTLGRVALPSGKITKPEPIEWIGDLREMAAAPNVAGEPKTVPSKLLREFVRFSPGGIVDIEPKDVISNGTVERYVVLPQQAGLIQLVQDGKIELKRFDQRVGRHHREAYLALAPFARFPAGLNGAHSVAFVLPDDFAMPEGSSGHSKVIRMVDVTRKREKKRDVLRKLPRALQ